jgi:hypothetical protein
MWPIHATKYSLFKDRSEIFPLKRQENKITFLGMFTRIFTVTARQIHSSVV